MALNPARYEELLDHWERTVGPLRNKIEGGVSGVFDDKVIIDNFQRADSFLDKIDPTEGRDEKADLIAQFDKVAVVLFSDQLRVAGNNPLASQVLGAEPDLPLTELKIDQFDHAVLSGQILRMLPSGGRDPVVLRIRSSDKGRFIVLHMRVCAFRNQPPLVIAITSEVVWPVRATRPICCPSWSRPASISPARTARPPSSPPSSANRRPMWRPSKTKKSSRR